MGMVGNGTGWGPVKRARIHGYRTFGANLRCTGVQGLVPGKQLSQGTKTSVQSHCLKYYL